MVECARCKGGEGVLSHITVCCGILFIEERYGISVILDGIGHQDTTVRQTGNGCSPRNGDFCAGDHCYLHIGGRVPWDYYVYRDACEIEKISTSLLIS